MKLILLLKKTDTPYFWEHLDRDALYPYLESFGFYITPNAKRKGGSFEASLNNWYIWYNSKGWTKAYLNPQTNRYQNHDWRGHEFSDLQDLLNEIYVESISGS